MDVRTRENEVLKEGRVQVMLNSLTTLPLLIPIWVDDLKFMLTVEREEEVEKLMGEDGRNGLRMKEKKATGVVAEPNRDRRRKTMTPAAPLQISNWPPI